MKFIIGLGLLSFRNLYALFASAAFILRRYSLSLLYFKTQYPWSFKPILFTFFMFLGQLVLGVFDFSLYRFSREKVKNASKDIKVYVPTNVFDLVKPKNPRIHINNYLVIAGIILLEGGCFYLAHLLDNFDKSKVNIMDEGRGLKLMSDSFFSYLFFKYRVQRHHYLSIALMLIGVTFVFVQDFIKGSIDYPFIFIYFLLNATNSLKDCMEKWLMENKFYSPLRLLFIKGLIGTVATLSMLMIIKATHCSMTFCEDIYEMSTIIFTSVTVSMCFLLFNAGFAFYNLFCILIKAHFNTTYLSVSDCSSFIIWTIAFEMQKKTISDLAYIISGFVFIFVGSVVYNEIVIIYLCGLETYTKKEISERSDQDHLLNRIKDIDVSAISDNI